MPDDSIRPNELDDAEEARLVADADEGEETLPEFADARDAGAGDVLADAGEGARVEGMVRAGLTMVPEVTVDFEAAGDDRSTLDRDLPIDTTAEPSASAADPVDRSARIEAPERPEA